MARLLPLTSEQQAMSFKFSTFNLSFTQYLRYVKKHDGPIESHLTEIFTNSAGAEYASADHYSLYT